MFLDEIGALPLELQPKLLRAIEKRVVPRPGSNTQRTVDVRSEAATNRHLWQEVGAGRFRVDLYHSLAGIALRMQPLRNRREDIPFLASLFLAEVCAQMGSRSSWGRGLGGAPAAGLVRGTFASCGRRCFARRT